MVCNAVRTERSHGRRRADIVGSGGRPPRLHNCLGCSAYAEEGFAETLREVAGAVLSFRSEARENVESSESWTPTIRDVGSARIIGIQHVAKQPAQPIQSIVWSQRSPGAVVADA